MTVRSVLILLSAAGICAVATWSTVAAPPESASQQAAPSTAKPADDPTFATTIQPFLKKYCIDCHKGEKPKGGVSLDAYQSEAHARKDRKNWLTVQHVLAAGEMPPRRRSRSRRKDGTRVRPRTGSRTR